MRIIAYRWTSFLLTIGISIMGCAAGTEKPDGGGGASASSGETTSSMASGGAAGGGGMAGAGGTSGAGGGSVCQPGASEPCYTGPAGTKGVGVCKEGMMICNANGMGYGPCTGEIAPTVENCTTPAEEDCDVAPDCGAHLFSKRFGDANAQYGLGHATDSAGNIVIVGYFGGTVDFGGGALSSAGANDVFITKLDSSGKHVWSKRFGDAAAQLAQSVAIDAAGNIVVSGWFAGTLSFGGATLSSAGGDDIFVVKLDPSGNHLWSKRFGDASSQHAEDLTLDANGNVIMVGNFQGSVDFGGGPLAGAGANDVFVVEFDGAGNHVWSKRFGDSADQIIYGVATDAAGNVLMIGDFMGTVNFGGSPLTSAGLNDIFAAKLSGANGAHVWSRRFGDASLQHGEDIEADAAGNVVMTGTIEGSTDFGGGTLSSAGDRDVFVAKLDAGGAHVWSQRFGDSSEQGAQNLAIDPKGNIAIAGYFQGTLDFGGGPLSSAGMRDIVVAQLNADGAHRWSRSYGDSSSQTGQNIALDPAGNIVLFGHYPGTIDFGGGLLTSAGSVDIFIAKFAP